jgi:hypothetical protein
MRFMAHLQQAMCQDRVRKSAMNEMDDVPTCAKTLSKRRVLAQDESSWDDLHPVAPPRERSGDGNAEKPAGGEADPLL